MAERKIESTSASELLRNDKGKTLVIHGHKDRVVPHHGIDVSSK